MQSPFVFIFPNFGRYAVRSVMPIISAVCGNVRFPFDIARAEFVRDSLEKNISIILYAFKRFIKICMKIN